MLRNLFSFAHLRADKRSAAHAAAEARWKAEEAAEDARWNAEREAEAAEANAEILYWKAERALDDALYDLERALENVDDVEGEVRDAREAAEKEAVWFRETLAEADRASRLGDYEAQDKAELSLRWGELRMDINEKWVVHYTAMREAAQARVEKFRQDVTDAAQRLDETKKAWTPKEYP